MHSSTVNVLRNMYSKPKACVQVNNGGVVRSSLVVLVLGRAAWSDHFSSYIT